MRQSTLVQVNSVLAQYGHSQGPQGAQVPLLQLGRPCQAWCCCSSHPCKCQEPVIQSGFTQHTHTHMVCRMYCWGVKAKSTSRSSSGSSPTNSSAACTSNVRHEIQCFTWLATVGANVLALWEATPTLPAALGAAAAALQLHPVVLQPSLPQAFFQRSSICGF